MIRQRLGVVTQFSRWAPMVGWYDPLQLARTGVDVIISTIFAQYDDRRPSDMADACTKAADPIDYSMDERGAARETFWIDYVSDVGDGWHSTYQVAYTVSRQTLALQDPSGTTHNTERGQVMIFGGDEVYPVASRSAYQNKLVRPYEAALRDSVAPNPHLYVVPGNHDWYDNLVSFRSLFCTGRWFAGWKTQQRTSYFALKLPHRWWLIGTDVQLDSDIDAVQLAYFREVAAQMEPDDRIVLCLAEPHWIYARAYGKDDDNCNESNLAFLERRVFNRKISVYLAGDLHHYRRHADPAGAQKITCGGGGAFLHPTHGVQVDQLAGDYTVKAAFPPPRDSRRMTWRNLLFPVINPKFGFAIATVYVLLAWAVNVNVAIYGLPEYNDVLRASLDGVVQNQSAVMWLALLCGGFVLFTDTHSKRFRWIAGPLHAAAHVLAVGALGWWATFLTVKTLGLAFGSLSQLLLAGTLIFALGWVVGPLVMGVYFVIALNGFGRHTNEAFSSLRSPDWKSFLRIKVEANGLTIYPIGIRRVWKAWRINPGGPESPEWVPDDTAPRRQHGTVPALIEAPIFVSHR